jgi:hypothetical protein|tara:strand:+ start:738 stop:1316 length:579 start_codon:yes stop_codon:yes gene_type:complete
MKNALINIETKRIIKVQEDAYEDGYYDTDYREVVQISNAKAATFEASDEPLFLINGNIVTFKGKMEIEQLERREERFIEFPDMFKSRKSAEIKKDRDAEYNSILTTSDGFQFKADLETIIDTKTIIEILPDGGSFPDYKCADGSYNTISKTQFQTAISEGIQRKSAAFSREKELNETIANATTFAELNVIVW